jgi:hypothetical protein
MEHRRLSPWTLGLRLDGDALECSLGDGRRLAWRADRPAHVLQARGTCTVAEFVGDELASRLAGSEPRPLILLYDGQGPIDRVDWDAVLRRAPHRGTGVERGGQVGRGRPFPQHQQAALRRGPCAGHQLGKAHPVEEHHVRGRQAAPDGIQQRLLPAFRERRRGRLPPPA